MFLAGTAFLLSDLSRTGYPRKLGRFGAAAFDAGAVDLAVGSMVHWGATLGACHPRLALALIAAMMEGAGGLNFDKAFESVSGEQHTSPIRAVNGDPAGLSSGFDERYTVFQSRMRSLSSLQKYAQHFELTLLSSLLWGCLRPAAFFAWHENMTAAAVRRWRELGRHSLAERLAEKAGSEADSAYSRLQEFDAYCLAAREAGVPGFNDYCTVFGAHVPDEYLAATRRFRGEPVE